MAMTLASLWPPVREGELLIAPDTPVPSTWLLDRTAGLSGWTRLTTELNRLQRESNLLNAGWTLFFMASAITGRAYGWNRPRMFNNALNRLIADVRLQKCNCLEVDNVASRSFLRLPYVSITVRPRHIQKGMVFDGQ